MLFVKKKENVSTNCKSCVVEPKSALMDANNGEARQTRNKYFGPDIVTLARAQLFKLLLGRR